jgi:DNA invertase Pin-like site-specific DNA recombinase
VVAKLDRLGRKLRLLADLMEGEVGLVVCDQPAASSLLLLLGAIAEGEARTISLRPAALGSIKAKLDRGEAHTSRRSGRRVARLGNPGGCRSPVLILGPLR